MTVIYALHHLLSSVFVHCTIKSFHHKEILPDGCPVYRLVTVILHDLFLMKWGSLGHFGVALPAGPEYAVA
jgi:hypothetical protein